MKKRIEEEKQSASEYVDANKDKSRNKDKSDPKIEVTSRKKKEEESEMKNESEKESVSRKESECEKFRRDKEDHDKKGIGNERNDENEYKNMNNDENRDEVDPKNQNNDNIDGGKHYENVNSNDYYYADDYRNYKYCTSSHCDTDNENVDYEKDVDIFDINIYDLDIDIEHNDDGNELDMDIHQKYTYMENEEEYYRKGREDVISEKNDNYKKQEMISELKQITIGEEGDDSRMEFLFHPAKVVDVLPTLDPSLSEAKMESILYEGDDDDYAIGEQLSFLCDSSRSNHSAASPISNGGEVLFNNSSSTDNSPNEKINFYDKALKNDGLIIPFMNKKMPIRKTPPFNERWNMRYKELVEFHSQTGHANVPHTYPQNPQLARWVKRQRRQYKLREEGKKSAISIDRLSLLESIGFVWDSHELSWRDKFEKLKEYQDRVGNCNVTCSMKEHRLGTWVKCQRRQYKLFKEGKPSAMLPERIAELEAIGFEWKVRKKKIENSCVAEAKNKQEN